MLFGISVLYISSKRKYSYHLLVKYNKKTQKMYVFFIHAFNLRYVPTGNTVSRQVIGICVVPVVTEYRTEEFYDKKKGRNVHSAFPDQVADDVNYESIPFSLEHQVQCISGENGPVRLRYHRWGTPAMSRDDKRPVGNSHQRAG